MSRIRKVIIAAVAAVLVLAGIVLAVRHFGASAVEVYPVANMSGWWEEGDTLGGMVSEGSTQRVILRDAEVVSIDVEEGDVVRKGDVLMVYDTTSFELTLLSDKARVAVAEADLAMARRELARIQGLAPSEAAPEPTVETIDHGALDIRTTIDKGDSPSSEGDSGMVFLVGPDTTVSAEFLRWLRDTGKSCELRIYKDDVFYGSWVIDGSKLPDVTVVYEEWTPPEPVVPDVPDEPAEPDDPADPGDGADDGGDGDPDAGAGGDEGDPDAGAGSGADAGGTDAGASGSGGATGGTGSGAATNPYGDETLYVRREVEAIDSDWRVGNGITFASSGMTFATGSVTTYGTLVCETPEPYERYEEVVHEFTSEGEDYVHSRSELAEMAREQQASIASLELDLRSAQVTYQQDLLVGANGEVTAQISGTVSYVEDPSVAKPGDKFIEVRGDESYIVTLYVNELDLSDVSIGDEYEVTAYESGSYATASVTDIGTTPAEGSYGYGEANPNSSWYPVTTVVDGGLEEGTEMIVGEYCEATPLGGMGLESGDTVIISRMFVRKDGRGSFVMVDDGTGHLERRAVTTGRIIWGSEIEVTSGLSAEDLIAFPYGKDVVEGAPTTEKEYPEYY